MSLRSVNCAEATRLSILRSRLLRRTGTLTGYDSVACRHPSPCFRTGHPGEGEWTSPHSSAGPHDADGYFTAIGYENFFDHYSTTIKRSSGLTISPSRAQISLTTPLRGELTCLLIFMASIMATRSPSLTGAPTFCFYRKDQPRHAAKHSARR